METRALGRSNLKLSLVGLGCNNFGARIDYASSEKMVRRALDLGINHFDTADIYGAGASEEFLGKALGARRKDIVLATKFGQRKRDQAPVRGGSSAYVRSAVEASLKRLGTDWIDLLIMHVPDPSTPIEETLRALEDLRRAGKVRYVGASNFKSSRLTEASAVAERLEIDGFVGCQDELNVLYRENEKSLLPRMKALGLGLIPYRPLVGGALSGKYHKGVALPKGSRFANAEAGAKRFLDPNWHRIEALRNYAESRGLHTARACHELAGAAADSRIDHRRRNIGGPIGSRRSIDMLGDIRRGDG